MERRRKLSTCATSGPAILGATGAETITAKHWPARSRFERHAVRLAALVADNLKLFAFLAGALPRTTEVLPARVATGLATFGMGQSTLPIVILFSFTKRESISAFGTSNFKIWHRCLPGSLEIYLCKLGESLLHEWLPVQQMSGEFGVPWEAKRVTEGADPGGSLFGGMRPTAAILQPSRAVPIPLQSHKSSDR